MTELPAFFKIEHPPPELGLGDDDDDHYKWWRHYDRDRGDAPSPIQAAKAFPEAIAVEPAEALRTAKVFACSGSLDSRYYREATRFRTMPEMGWDEARVALRRLAIVYEKSGFTAVDEVRLAEFALTADGYAGFAGRKADHAAKLRDELAEAREKLYRTLSAELETARRNTAQLARPITRHGEDMADYHSARQVSSTIARAFWTVVPTASDEWVPVAKATPEQILAALDYLRSTHTVWERHRPAAISVRDRLQSPHLPTASEYGEALHITEMLVFTSEKLLSLYAGIIYSMPIYRLYPATTEAEAIALWWPWGRPAPLIDGGPPRPPKPGKQTLDPSLITATRPQDIVREVMQKTGINRTTAQRMTAAMRAQMRSRRKLEAEHLLRLGHSKSEVARRVGLSASRISAMFKGKKFSRWGLPLDPEDDDDEMTDRLTLTRALESSGMQSEAAEDDPMSNIEGELFLMTNLYPRSTGLPMVIWVGPSYGVPHDIRIKVSPAHGQRMDPRNLAVVALRPTPHVIAGQLTATDLRAVSQWMALNEKAIIDHWNGLTDGVQLGQQLRPLSPPIPP